MDIGKMTKKQIEEFTGIKYSILKKKYPHLLSDNIIPIKKIYCIECGGDITDGKYLDICEYCRIQT